MTRIVEMVVDHSFVAFTSLWALIATFTVALLFLRRRARVTIRETQWRLLDTRSRAKVWRPDPSWMRWLRDMRGSMNAGVSLATFVATEPVPGARPPQEGELLSRYLERCQSSEPTGWRRLTLQLLHRVNVHGLPVGALVTPLLQLQEQFHLEHEEVRLLMKPVWVQLASCIAAPAFVLAASQWILGTLAMPRALLVASPILFTLGAAWILWEMHSLRRLLYRVPATTDPAGVLRSVLLPQLIRLGSLAGFALEQALAFSFEALACDATEPVSLYRIRISENMFPELRSFLSRKQWQQLRGLLLRASETGGALAGPMEATANEWFEQWSVTVKTRLKILPYRLLLPMALCFVPCALGLMLGPVIQQALNPS